MIDKKKIEEAARKHAEEACEGMSPLVKMASIEAFKAGINWFLDNIWHDISEEPKRDKGRAIILVELRLRGNITYTSFNLHNELSIYKAHLKEKNVARWLYIEDLMKGGK